MQRSKTSLRGKRAQLAFLATLSWISSPSASFTLSHHAAGARRMIFSQHLSSCQRSAALHTQQEGNTRNNRGSWKVGRNVYDDLDRLQQAITLANSDQHLRQVEDRERLDYFASQRRPVARDVQAFVLAPFLAALVMSILCRTQAMLARATIVASDLQFWIGTFVAPLLLFFRKRQSLPAKSPLPPELRGLDPEYYRFVATDWEDPRTSCRDHVLCLLEQWSSVVLGAALLGSVRPRQSVVLSLAARLMTRLGVVASLHQYPKLLYQLQRRHQPRPLDCHTMHLQQLVASALRWAPWGIASDLACLLARMPVSSIVGLTALVGASSLKFSYCPSSEGESLRSASTRAALRRQSATRVSLSMIQALALGYLGVALRHFAPQAISYMRNEPSACIRRVIWFALQCTGPILHLLAVRRLFRFAYTHDISLANDYETITSTLSDPAEMKERMKYRYRLEWREPQRISQTFSNWKRAFSYWLLFQGGVEDKLRKEFHSNQKGEAYKRGLTLLQRYQQDRRNNPNASRRNSREWKQRAMKEVAATHEEEYKQGTYSDPLGIAVQRTFGIGLGFNFDHMTDLKPGEIPSARRLQARAAKSAIKRVQKIYDADEARQELNSIPDAAEREKRKAEMRQAADLEIQYLASRLSELIPTHSQLDPKAPTAKVEQLLRRNFKRTSDHEMNVDTFVGGKTLSLDSLLGRTGPEDDESERDDEFLEAWIERQASGSDVGNSTALV